MLMDEVMGWQFVSMGIPFAVTANLKIDYRQPATPGTQVVIQCQCTKQEGRKLFLQATMTSTDGATVYCQATSLFIIPKDVYQDMMMEQQQVAAECA